MRRVSLLVPLALIRATHAAVRADLLARGYLAEPKTKSQKAESRGAATSRPPVHNPIKEGSNHGISQV